MEQNRQYIEEDEIDLKELWKTIVNRKKFVFIFTFIVTIGAIIWALTRTPIYEVKAFIEVGSISHNNNNNNNNNNKAIENPNNLVQRLQIIYMKNIPKEQDTSITKISTVKKTINLIEITANSISNDKATEKLNQIIDDIKSKHQIEINNYINLINTNINNLKAQKLELEDKNNRFEGSLAVKYNLTTKLNELSLQISSNNIKNTQIVGKIITNNYPIKPKKKLIVTVAFVTGLILSIFLVFFLEFIRNDEKEGK